MAMAMSMAMAMGVTVAPRWPEGDDEACLAGAAHAS